MSPQREQTRQRHAKPLWQPLSETEASSAEARLADIAWRLALLEAKLDARVKRRETAVAGIPKTLASVSPPPSPTTVIERHVMGESGGVTSVVLEKLDERALEMACRPLTLEKPPVQAARETERIEDVDESLQDEAVYLGPHAMLQTWEARVLADCMLMMVLMAVLGFCVSYCSR
jgi:hypothetical protein